MYDVNFTNIINLNMTNLNSSWPIKKCDNGWTFDYTDVPYASISAELQWVCDKTYLSTATQSAFFVGSIIGGFIFGYIGDHYGRIPALVSCNAVGFFASIATSFCNSFWSFAIVRMIVGMSFDNCFSFLFIIVIEYVGPKYRTIVTNMSFGIYYAIASSILPWIAYWIANWKILSVVTALPLAIAFLGPWIVPESARWYLTAGKIDKAIEMLKKIEKINGKNVDPDIYNEFKNSCNDIIENDKKFNNYTVLDLFKLPRLARITITLVFYWILTILVFDGHVWNMKLLHRDVFTSFSIAALTELPAAFIVALFLDKWGRRWMGFTSMIFCGIFSFVAIFTPQGLITVSMAVLARFGVDIATNIGFQFAAELLPTVVRAQGVSLIHLVGHFAHIIGPYIVYLADITRELPLICLGTASIISAFLTLFLPETLGQHLPGSLEEGNDFGRDQSIWWIPCLSKSQRKQQQNIENK
ncbi:organic cation transporter 1-like [Aphidius gifuensis]|nr:organic cation transporter 1-like [Aphidius gifuensis]